MLGKSVNGWTISGIIVFVASFSDVWLRRLERVNFVYADVPKAIDGIAAYGYEILAYPPPFLRLALIVVGCLAIWRGLYFRNHPSSPLSIEFSGKVSPYFEETQIGKQTVQTYRVRVKNRKQYSSIGRVILYLKDINPQPNALYEMPVPLHFASDMKTPFDGWCLLQEGGGEFVDVVTYRVSTMRDNMWTPPIYIEHTCDGESQEIQGGVTYRIELEAVGLGVPGTSKAFCVFVENGNLKMVPEKTPLLSWITRRA